MNEHEQEKSLKFRATQLENLTSSCIALLGLASSLGVPLTYTEVCNMERTEFQQIFAYLKKQKDIQIETAEQRVRAQKGG